MNIRAILEQYITTIGPTDILDIIIVAFVLYKLTSLIRESSGGQVLKGLVILLVVTQITEWTGLHVMGYILRNTVQLGLIALVIVFQPELRRMLDRMGRSRFPSLLADREGHGGADQGRVISCLTEACGALSWSRTGALIVIERETRLGDIIKTGTALYADVTVELIKTIFFPNTALHDGAAIVTGGRIAAAGCVLPLSGNANLSRDLGTRHRAGVGVSENSDCIAIVVSEETGAISVATGGMLKRHLSPDTLEKLLRSELMSKTENVRRSPFAFWRSAKK